MWMQLVRLYSLNIHVVQSVLVAYTALFTRSAKPGMESGLN